MSSGAPLIVVIDDDSAFLDMMSEVLRDEGYRVIASIGSETERVYGLVAREQPALVILDLLLVEQAAGQVLLDLVRGNPLLRHTRLLICSARARDLREKEGLLREKNCDTLEKPFTAEELLAKISNAIGSPSS